jgi:hypothetical protein
MYSRAHGRVGFAVSAKKRAVNTIGTRVNTWTSRGSGTGWMLEGFLISDGRPSSILAVTSTPSDALPSAIVSVLQATKHIHG